ncbi:MAG: molybdopterin molybdotransferase MoeA [Ahniella sp.]|nr:molybdopterin molybdotransferase MoeA [Ahniella sp.]
MSNPLPNTSAPAAPALTPPKPIAYAEAIDHLRALAAALPRPQEWRSISQCLHAVLADDIHAPADVPGFRHSAMDGFALAHSESGFAAGSRFRISGETLAGGAAASLAPNECVAVATGAIVPDACGTVVPKENVDLEGDVITLRCAVVANANIRAATDDFARGHLIAPAGSVVDAALMATAGSCGLARLPVFESLRVAVIVTGDEVVRVGEPTALGQRIDSNGPLVAAWFAERGLSIHCIGPLRDDQSLLQKTVSEAAAGHDLVLVTGGASVGPVDHTPAVLNQLGQIVFWRVAVKPGMPVLAARLGQSVVLGLPGNPVSVFASLHAFVAPLLRMWSRQSDRPMLKAQLAAPLRKSHGRLEWRRGNIAVDPEGRLVATIHPSESSGAMRSVVESNTLIELAADRHDWCAGDLVPILPYRRVF